jgi:hypothetical protein
MARSLRTSGDEQRLLAKFFSTYVIAPIKHYPLNITLSWFQLVTMSFVRLIGVFALNLGAA